MQVILLERVGKLGDLGDKVNVKAGFGRNFLIPYGKAVPATGSNVADFEARRSELEAAAAEKLGVVALAVGLASGGGRLLQTLVLEDGGTKAAGACGDGGAVALASALRSSPAMMKQGRSVLPLELAAVVS